MKELAIFLFIVGRQKNSSILPVANYSRGGAHGNGECRQISGHQAVGSDDTVVPNGNSVENCRLGSKPSAIADGCSTS